MLRKPKIIIMATKELWMFATPNGDSKRASIMQLDVTTEQHEVKSNYLLWFNKTNLEALLERMRVYIHLFPFSLRGEAKE